ncbi:MAG: ABC transporter ATP-binding protein [Bacteroidetes bacterium]|nr:ABC transporter ATP-binding protein [Bacteroidota bacterium]
MLVCKDIQKKYETLHVLQGVSMEVKRGEVVSLVGASGAGKSTLLHLLGTLDVPDAGEVWLNDIQVSRLKGKALAQFRNQHIGFIFQFHHLLPEFTALENVCIPGWLGKRPQRQVKDRAAALLERLGLKDRMEHKPAALSGGEQQRVSVARALINQPDIILADEPSGNLDSVNARALHQLFFELRAEMNQTFLIVTHNEELAAQCNRTIHMKDGKIVEATPAASI